MPDINKSLHESKVNKNDEFYTLMEDIENELSQYDFSQFNGKIVYCNCDDPTWSNFFKFFTKWGRKTGIKECHFTNYANGKREFKQLSLFEGNDLAESAEDDKKGTAHHWIYTPETNRIVKKELKGNGDFRSAECIEILKKSDIVVTNSPFSLFREYVMQLIQFERQFLIIGNKNAITYKEIFHLIMADKLWLGCRGINQDMWLAVPEDKQYEKVKNGIRVKHIMGCWFTNLDVKRRTHTDAVA